MKSNILTIRSFSLLSLLVLFCGSSSCERNPNSSMKSASELHRSKESGKSAHSTSRIDNSNKLSSSKGPSVPSISQTTDSLNLVRPELIASDTVADNPPPVTCDEARDMAYQFYLEGHYKCKKTCPELWQMCDNCLNSSNPGNDAGLCDATCQSEAICYDQLNNYYNPGLREWNKKYIDAGCLGKDEKTIGDIPVYDCCQDMPNRLPRPQSKASAD